MSTLTAGLEAGQILTRAAVQLRVADDDAREFEAIGVPYGVPTETRYWREEWAPGAVQGGETALIFQAHDHVRAGMPIGRVASGEDTPAGYKFRARLSDTTAGRDAYTLLRDGVIDRVSIGFELHDYQVREEEDGSETVIITRATAKEFSLVPFPAYDDATVTAVRHDDTERPRAMPETLTRSAVDQAVQDALRPLQDEIGTLNRSVALLGDGGNDDSVPGMAAQFRSMGHWLQEVARGNETAMELHRAAAAGTTTADIPAPQAGENFLGTQIKFVEERRKFANLFSRGPLPDKGQNVEYAQFDQSASTFLVGKQPAELDALPGQSRLVFRNASAPVETYGGWTRLSRQAIERSATPYLDTLLRGMTIEYAKQTNIAVRDAAVLELDAIIARGGDDVLTLPNADPAAATVTDWANVIVDSGDIFEDRGGSSAGLAVTTDIFKTLAGQTAADGRPLMNLTGTGVNVSGTMNLQNGDGELLRIPVRRIPKLTGRAFFWDPAAIETRESAGAPFQLQDEDIIILGRDFSLYGYLAVTIPFPGLLVPVTFGTPAI